MTHITVIQIRIDFVGTVGDDLVCLINIWDPTSTGKERSELVLEKIKRARGG